MTLSKRSRSSGKKPKKTSIFETYPNLLAGIMFSAVALLVFSNSFSDGLIFDSKALILQDPRVHEATGRNLQLILGHSYWWPLGSAGLYRPLITFSYLFNYAVLGNGTDPAGYHAVNLALHVINTFLVYLLALRFTRHYWRSVLLAVLWSVHPILTESVTNIAGRPDLLAGTAILSGLYIYLKGAEASGARRFAWMAGLLATTAIGVFSKETAVVILGVVILYEILWWQDRRVPLSLGCLAIVLPLQVMLYQRSIVLASEAPADFPFTDNPLVSAGFWQGKLTAIEVLGRYLGLIVWPANLSADYSYSQVPLSSGSLQDWMLLLLVAVVATAIVVVGRKNHTVLFVAGFTFLTLLPASNLIFPIGATMAERFLYLPSIGVLACLFEGACWVWRRFNEPSFGPVILGLVICLLGGRAWKRNSDWHDELSLAKATVNSSPRSFKSHQMLAETLWAMEPSHDHIDGVIKEAEKGIALLNALPDDRNTPQPYRLAGDSYIIRGERLKQQAPSMSSPSYRQAVTVLEHAAAIVDRARERQIREMKARGVREPTVDANVNDDVYRLLSVAYLALGDTDKAFVAAMEYRKRAPLTPAIYLQLASVLAAAGQLEDAGTVLMEGMVVTSDMDLRRQIIAFYASGLPGSECALIAGPNGPAINPACPLVHRNLCGGAVDAIRIRLQAKRRDLARELKKTFAQEYGCPTKPLEEAFPSAEGGR